MKHHNTYKNPRNYLCAAILILMSVVSIFPFPQAQAQPTESTGTCTFGGCDDCFIFQILGPFKEVLIKKNPDVRLITPCNGDNLDGFFEFLDQAGEVNVQSGVGHYVETGTFTGDIGEEKDVILPVMCTGEIDNNSGTFSFRCVIKGSNEGPLGILDIPVLSVPSEAEYTLKIISN